MVATLACPARTAARCRRALTSIGIMSLAACAAPAVSRSAPTGDTLLLLAPDPASDAVHADDTEDSLVARYGAAYVVRGEVDQGEGMLVNGTVLFPDDAMRRLEIQWQDTVARRTPVQVNAVGRGWMIAPGIMRGTTLGELERMNGAPFELTGFRGHYSGTVIDWHTGRLAPLGAEEDGWVVATLRLQPRGPYPEGVSEARYATEDGFLSSDPGMQLLQPRVVYMAVHPRE
ncbi:MAG TPA: hypothetical protein VFT96_11695 [Gemmatimonadaceae bacterium]|nr:hypothetical protein [Gemmatimonadaceae bacterium]